LPTGTHGEPAPLDINININGPLGAAGPEAAASLASIMVRHWTGRA